MHPARLESHLDHGLGVALVGLRLVLLGALLAAPFTPASTLEHLVRTLDPVRSWWWGPLTRADCGRAVIARLLLYHLDATPTARSCASAAMRVVP
jgi:hypothetical protein